MIVNNLNQFKKELKNHIDKSFYSWSSVRPEAKVKRVLKIVQTNSLAMTLPNSDQLSWLDFGKAKNYTFINDGQNNTIVRIYNPVMDNYLYYMRC